MTRDVATCGPADSMEKAARLMWERDCGAVPVVGTDGRLVGMVTDRDLCMAALTRERMLSEMPVSDAMSKDVARVRANEGAEAAHGAMREWRVRRVPVVDGEDRVVGIVSLNDLCLAAERGSAPDMRTRRRDVTATLARVCEHRPERNA